MQVLRPVLQFPPETLLAAQCGAPYVVVNRGLTDHDGLSEVALRLEGDVSAIFPAAVQAALGPIHR